MTRQDRYTLAGVGGMLVGLFVGSIGAAGGAAGTALVGVVTFVAGFACLCKSMVV